MTTALTPKDLPPPPPGKSGWPWTQQSRPLPERMPDGSKWPRLSIVTPSYNQSQFIEETIRSVLLQGYPNLEYIIIDGGSTDDSREIIKKYEQFLAYWVSEKDRGQAHAVNKGILKSTGDILGWINSDDLYLKDTFRQIVRAFQRYPATIFVHGDRILLNKDSQVTGWSVLPPFNPSRYGYVICSESSFWRRYAMNLVGLLNEDLQFAMDLEFFCRLFTVGKFTKLNQFLGAFRCYPENKTSTLQDICAIESQREWKKIFGQNSQTLAIQPKIPMIRHITTPFVHFSMIGIPYFRKKFLSK
jgi:cellulose synthase/poly-beta-1,6-N-acetylglucosamine synthase-like glycosyltransferase